MINQNIENGSTVKVRDPHHWKSGTRRKIEGRVGVVRFYRPGDMAYIVDFPAIGRRHKFTHFFYERDLLVMPSHGGEQ